MPLPDEILAESSALFHDTRAQDIDPEAHAAFVIERVLDRGTLRSVGALLRYYERDPHAPRGLYLSESGWPEKLLEQHFPR